MSDRKNLSIVSISHPDSERLYSFGELLLGKWEYEPHFVPSNEEQNRVACLKVICSTELSGEILMFCIRNFYGAKLDLINLDME